MKLYDLVQNYGRDCYVITLVSSRNNEGGIEDLQIDSFASEFSQAVNRRRELRSKNLDVLIVPPLLKEDVSPTEVADFCNEYYGWDKSMYIRDGERLLFPPLLLFTSK